MGRCTNGGHAESAADADLFRRLEVERTRALVQRDIAAIEAMHAPEYELITPKGRVMSRERYIALIAAEPFYANWEHGPMSVRVCDAMAIVRYRAKLTFPSGKVVECWHTDSYERRAGVWMAVWSQATELPLPP